jgi:hypothetical protein
LRIGRKAQTAIIDSGAATSIITKTLLDRLGYEINRPSKLIVVTANGSRTRSLGIVDNIPVILGKIEIRTSFQVLESRDEVLILGNDWLKFADADMSWRQSTLTIRKNGITVKAPITFTKTSKVITQEGDDSEEEDYEDEELLEEFPIYFSDYSETDSDNDLEYNPWTEETSPNYESSIHEETIDNYSDNPAIYLAEAESSGEWNTKQDLHLGPLDHHQQTQFQNTLNEYADICAKSQTDIGRTDVIEHQIITRDAHPIKQ